MKIKNKLNSPLIIDIGRGHGLHLWPLEEREINESIAKAPQVQNAEKAGYIKIIVEPEQHAPENQAEIRVEAVEVLPENHGKKRKKKESDN